MKTASLVEKDEQRRADREIQEKRRVTRETGSESKRSSTEVKENTFQRSVTISFLRPSLRHGLDGDADVGQRPVPPGLGRGHHQLPAASVEGHSFRGQHHRHLPDHLGGHLDDLCGPEHGADPV